ncbi:hypothetical protein WH47_08645 [Habropoda laboriosa]|uniref:Uncharacterized protein n=1 Tax=Habropoda laboriosa TaxID=597456 RepID=A0A0L7RH54_9HYME|nr:hypothetical protein WH47_08645 [Habropoda laboriosa]
MRTNLARNQGATGVLEARTNLMRNQGASWRDFLRLTRSRRHVPLVVHRRLSHGTACTAGGTYTIVPSGGMYHQWYKGCNQFYVFFVNKKKKKSLQMN